jgi:hypothetical protein
MKKLFFLLTIIGMLCAACGGSTAQSDAHTHADGTTHVHTADCDQGHDHATPDQEHFVAGDHDCDHDHDQGHDCDHDHGNDSEVHSHEGGKPHTH